MSAIRISLAGSAGLLLDVAGPRFDRDAQDRIHATARALRGRPGVGETVPGMNNLLILFDPLALDAAGAERLLRDAWTESAAEPPAGREVDVPVRYGGAEGPDLAEAARELGLEEDELIRRHAAGRYRVEAVGAMPGFVYLSGLDPSLAIPRRATPRAGVPDGAVIIGGGQAGIMPCTAPSGWRQIGRTPFRLFDPTETPPARLAPGDRLRFVAA